MKYKNLHTTKKIGILGGMGAIASCSWYKTIIELLQAKYQVIQDCEYPEMFILNVSLTGWSERGIEDEKAVKQQLKRAIQRIEIYKPSFIIMACNTVHHFYPYLQRLTDIPIINLVDTCAKYVAGKGYKKVGVLSSKTTNQCRLYQKYLENYGVEALTLDYPDQIQVNKIILSVLDGNCGNTQKLILKGQIEKLYKRGAEIVVLGCTELPMVLRQHEIRLPLIDAGFVLLNQITDDLYAIP